MSLYRRNQQLRILAAELVWTVFVAALFFWAGFATHDLVTTWLSTSR